MLFGDFLDALEGHRAGGENCGETLAMPTGPLFRIIVGGLRATDFNSSTAGCSDPPPPPRPFSAPLDTTRILDLAPYAIAAGALVFGVVALMQVRRARRQVQEASGEAMQQLGGMRASLDDYEAILSGLPELSMVWRPGEDEPMILGQSGEILPQGRRVEDVKRFSAWLKPADADSSDARSAG